MTQIFRNPFPRAALHRLCSEWAGYPLPSIMCWGFALHNLCWSLNCLTSNAFSHTASTAIFPPFEEHQEPLKILHSPLHLAFMSFFIKNVSKAYFVWPLCWYLRRQRWLKKQESPSGADSAVGLVAQSRLTLCKPMDYSPPGTSVHGDSLGKNTGVGCHALQGIFWTQRSNPGLPHCRRILYHLGQQGSPTVPWGRQKIIKVTLRWVNPGFVLRAVRENTWLCQMNWLKDRP